MKALIFFLFLMFSISLSAQTHEKETFQRITAEVSKFVVDTTEVPHDRLTKEIIKLRNAKGGFNINEAILFKIGEDTTKYGNVLKNSWWIL